MEFLTQNWLGIAKELNGKYKTINAESLENHSDPFLRKFDLKIPYSGSEIELFTTEFNPLKIKYNFTYDFITKISNLS